MNALQAKILILSYLYEFNEKWPSKQDYTSLPVLLASDKVKIPQSEFARSVVSSLIEDGHVKIATDKPGSKNIAIRITETGTDYLTEINKPILKKLFAQIVSFLARHWKILLPIVVTIFVAIIGAAVLLFIHFDSKTTSKPAQEESHTKTNKKEQNAITHINTKKPPNQ